jgi:protein-glutamine gamma-glutamyltransferase
VLLQLIKLYEQRANRDFAQLLILGPLLMVAGSISTYSLVFGLTFIAYLFLAMYCCLLFHLKVETDAARRLVGVPQQASGTMGGNETAMNRTLRRLSSLISGVAVTFAIGTFLFFPRGPGAGLLGPVHWRPSQTLTGFTDSVSFQNVAMIAQNPQEVAWVTVERNNQPWQGLLMLRGLTLDRYSGRGDGNGGTPFQWTRTSRNFRTFSLNAGEDAVLRPRAPNSFRQEIKLDPTGTDVLFAIAGMTSVIPDELSRIKYTSQDQVLQSDAPLIRQIRYEVVSTGELEADPGFMAAPLSPADRARLERIDPKVDEYARRPEVSGSDEEGPLAARRSRDVRVTPLDLVIARNIANYLRSNFTYTLDLTDAGSIRGQDPMVAFLYDLKRGHCEYFAGAMTLMCQSLGMQARMVVGFRCNNYNAMGNFFIVQQLHAHAWVEVLTDDGLWTTFDPTANRGDEGLRTDGFWQKARALFSFLEYTWANSVVAYEPGARQSAFQGIDQNIWRTADQSEQAIGNVTQWLDDKVGWVWSESLMSALLILATIIMAAGATWWLTTRLRLRRRAERIGLNALPVELRIRLARQLGFYDELLRLLERRRIHRPAHLTPMEFTDSLTFLPVDAFGSVRRLTEAFYHVRFGHMDLSDAQHQELRGLVGGVEASLTAMK